MRRSLSNEQWRAIEKALPPQIDRARVRSELERVLRLRAGPPPDLQRALRRLARDLGLASPLLGSAATDLKQTCADALRGPRLFSLQRGIIWAFHSAGGDCRIITPRKPKDEAEWPHPTGPVIDYFEAASLAIRGKSPGPDRIKKIVQLYLLLIFLTSTFAGAGGMIARADLSDIDGRPVVDDKGPSCGSS